jgi:endonuclease YncB( thermonuclease family)
MRKAAVLGFVLSAILWAAVHPAWAEKVRYVIDGDTLILENHQRVRLIGIDAPEISHRRYGKKGEPFGEDSRGFLVRLVQGKEVRLENGKEEFDRFGRRLSYVYLPDRTFVNRKMVEEGMARVYRKFPFEFRNDFLEAEKQAARGRLGLWKEAPPDPWAAFWDFVRASFQARPKSA